jgi:N6-adenosine-specific RNA methylase IME4
VHIAKFDVVLIDPPWEEYVRRAPGFVKEQDREAWTWQEIKSLDIGSIADTPSFVFLWCGSEEGLDAGRHCFERWDFRRIEDICWIKTNKRRDTEPDRKYLSAQHQDPHSMLVHTKEHCLVGMRGKLMRSQHGAFVHANCDHDILFSEEPPLGSTEKPEELYNLIERFCNGRRRLELFGEDHNMRPGWVTVGKNISQTNFNRQAYVDIFRDRNGLVYVSHNNRPPADGVPVLVPTTDVIERVRPKSPPPPTRPPPR